MTVFVLGKRNGRGNRPIIVSGMVFMKPFGWRKVGRESVAIGRAPCVLSLDILVLELFSLFKSERENVTILDLIASLKLSFKYIILISFSIYHSINRH